MMVWKFQYCRLPRFERRTPYFAKASNLRITLRLCHNGLDSPLRNCRNNSRYAANKSTILSSTEVRHSAPGWSVQLLRVCTSPSSCAAATMSECTSVEWGDNDDDDSHDPTCSCRFAAMEDMNKNGANLH
mmetsp:Transcript_24819/g.68727  ORF Transcript_24819/g.68727 Transcript_24819/m.68727 type:complete len:130 (-) Transcript_24819:830-1219(-)